MIDSIIRGMIGTFGNQVLDFYLQNSLAINGSLLFYALLVVYSQRVYQRSFQFLVIRLMGKRGDVFHGSAEEIKRRLARTEIPWSEANQISKWPFVVAPKSLLLRFKTPRTLQSLISLDLLSTEIKSMVPDAHTASQAKGKGKGKGKTK
ncbi:MAG: hypothetical protein VB089_18635 [Anaerolineaceae bacterium]|nr:hypothetical protein [Anaerolineaceae bacterium]